MIVIWIQYFYQITRQIFFFYRFIIFALIKRFEAEYFLWLCIPNHQGIYHIVIKTNDWHIVRYGNHRTVSLMDKAHIAILTLLCSHIAAKVHFMCILRAFDFKWIPIFQPVIRYFFLVAIFNLLFKHTITVTDTAAISCVSERRQRVHKAGSKSAQSTIS